MGQPPFVPLTVGGSNKVPRRNNLRGAFSSGEMMVTPPLGRRRFGRRGRVHFLPTSIASSAGVLRTAEVFFTMIRLHQRPPRSVEHGAHLKVGHRSSRHMDLLWKWKCQGLIRSGTHEITHFVLALTHGAGGAMLSCFMLGICPAFMPLASCVQSNNPPLGEHRRRTLGLNPRPHE